MGKLLKIFEKAVRISKSYQLTSTEKKILQIRDDIGLYNYPYLYTLYQAILVLRPKVIIDWGTKSGLTAIVMAMALKEIGEGGVIYGYDIFESYAMNKVGDKFPKSIAEYNVQKYGFQDVIKIEQKDYWKWFRSTRNFDLVYIDIDNDGDKILKLYDYCKPFMNKKVILFEGGSIERDQVKWMADRLPINAIRKVVNYTIIDKRFPSLSIIKF